MNAAMRSVVLALGLLCTGSLTGCGGRAANVSGKVIRGDISFIIAVDATDPRLKGEGIPGVEVQVYAERGAVLLGGATSDSKGNITVSIQNVGALLRPAEFDAEKEGFARTSTVMSIPAVDKRVLVILKPSGASPSR